MNKLILKPKNTFFILKSTTNFRISTKSSLNLNSKLKPKLLSPVVGPKQQSSSITREWVNHANWTINSNLENSNTNENVVQKLVCNQLESVADLAQNCLGLSDPTLAYFRKLCESGTELDHFIRGQSTLLLATSLLIEPNEQKHDPKLVEQQILLAKLTEFTHLAFVLHHKIIDSKENVANSIKQHNKIITILGDYLISDVYFNLAQMNESVELLNQFGTLWRDLSEGLFSNRENETFKKFPSIFAHSFKSAVILSFGNETSQNSAFEFGKNLGYYFKAIQEVENGFEIVDEQKMKIFKENALTNLDKLELNEQAKQCFHKMFDVKMY